MEEGLSSTPGRPAGKKEIYEDTYQRLDSLEETIRELEMTISDISSHPAVELVLREPQEAGKSPGDLGHGGDTALDLSQAKGPGRTKPALLPKPQLPPGAPQVHFSLLPPPPRALLCPSWVSLPLPLLPLCDPEAGVNLPLPLPLPEAWRGLGRAGGAGQERGGGRADPALESQPG